MRLFNILFPPRATSAAIAKERLKIVLAHERAGSAAPDFLPRLQRDLIEVVGRYVEMKEDMIRVNLGKSGETSLLEINIEIEEAKARATPARRGLAGAEAGSWGGRGRLSPSKVLPALASAAIAFARPFLVRLLGYPLL